MSELQSTIEFSVELYKFYNVDLFQRGMYQVRCTLKVSSKLTVEIEVSVPEVSAGLGSATVLGTYGACRPFQILYRNEEVSLKDVILFRCHMLVDGHRLKESLEKAEFAIILELWFSESSPDAMVMVSSRTLNLQLVPFVGLHYHLPVLFDYFHLSAISITIHAALTAIHQPPLKKGLLKYMQSCAPKSSKSWSSKIRCTSSTASSSPAQCSYTSLITTDPVLPSSYKIYTQINESPQIYLEAYTILLESSNNIKATIKEYQILLQQREGGERERKERHVVDENEKNLYTKKKNIYEKNLSRKKNTVSIVELSWLAELCAENFKLWNYFLMNFSCKSAIQQKLGKIHHSMRVRRFSEFFFVIYNPRKTAFGSFDTNYQKYLFIAELARRSKCMQYLPQLPVYCTALDGDYTTMPIIFEDQYQDLAEAGLPMFHKAPSYFSSTPKQDFEVECVSSARENLNCSCGLKTLEECRRQPRLQKSLSKAQMDFAGGEHSLPARHSKSLDQLQKCFHHHRSLSNLRTESIYGISSNHRPKASKQVANVPSYRRHQNIKMLKLEDLTQKKYNDRKYLLPNFNNTSKQTNGYFCDPYDFPMKNIKMQIRDDAAKKKSMMAMAQKKKVENEGTEFDSLINLFRSSSVQAFSTTCTNRPINEEEEEEEQRRSIYNTVSVGNRRHQKKLRSSNAFFKSNLKRENSYVYEDIHQNHLKCEFLPNEPVRNLYISPLSSTSSKEIPNDIQSPTNFDTMIRRVKSSSNLKDVKPEYLLFKAESLPSFIPNFQLLDYSSVKRYYNSSTSSTSSSSLDSEQSGLITSKSSSSLEHCPSRLLFNSTSHSEIIQNKFVNGWCSDEDGKKSRLDYKKNRKKAAHYLRNSSKVFEHAQFEKLPPESECLEVCNNLTRSDEEDLTTLPPPKQFRDTDSSLAVLLKPEADSDPSNDLNAVDNLLYHVLNSSKNVNYIKTKLNSSISSSLFHVRSMEDLMLYRGSNVEHQKIFVKSKSEFKSKLNFPGILYSDLNMFASTVPYFHVSDEFRVFSPEGMHLIVCVHGLDGNSADLRLIKTYLELGLPGAYLDFLMSETNQGDTFSDFNTMTDRLVAEILHYLETIAIRPNRVSFIGHSLGNIIIRSALTRPQMKFLLPRLHTFLSLSGPHLGTLYNNSGLVNMGMWFMQKWKKSGSLQQLCIKDANNPRQSFLYRLSQKSTLHNFKNILLCGSSQDRYVPLHSARIELCKDALKDSSEQGVIYREMVYNVISPIIEKKEVKLVRYDVHHALPSTANALIGRAAHIAVLDSELFIEKFMAVVGVKYFR